LHCFKISTKLSIKQKTTPFSIPALHLSLKAIADLSSLQIFMH
jgi:hypothetical protein